MAGAKSAAAGAVRRADQVYDEQVAQRETIDCGYAYTCVAHPRVPRCNFVGEVVLEGLREPPLECVERYFRERGLACHGWVPAAVQDPAAVAALVEPLGFVRREFLAYGLSSAGEDPRDDRVRVLGARAMRRAYTRVMEERSAVHAGGDGELAAAYTAVQLERLNDPQYDGFVGMIDDEPAGVVSVFQVGEIGRICDLWVAASQRGRGVGEALLRHAIATARRWALRPICTRVPAGCPVRRAQVEKLGFELGGSIVSFWKGVGEVEE